MGSYVGNLVAKRVSSSNQGGRSPSAAAAAAVKPFQYHHAGSFSYVGDGSAVMEVDVPVVGKVVLKGSTPLSAKPQIRFDILQALLPWPCGADVISQSRCR